jgi:hypothetical protein
MAVTAIMKTVAKRTHVLPIESPARAIATYSMALITCRRQGDASRNFKVIFIVQEVSFDTTQSVLELIPNKSFAVISIARHRSAIRVEAIAFPNLLEGHTKSNA